MKADASKTEKPLTYAQAQLIVHCPESYPRDRVRKAAALILSNLTARQDDVSAAMMAI